MRADYPPVDRLLHRIALGSTATAEIFHDIERGLYLKDAPPDDGGHVFVTGLARAGTTILLRELHATGAFGSLTYADMPLVLAPNLWARVSRNMRKDFDPVERAHGDGIAVNLDSPEAFDEVFWRIFRGKSYIRADGLEPHRPGNKAIAKYRDFIRLVLRRTGKARYLAKGNNNILRLGTLAAAMPDCTVLLVLREPLSHAKSLLGQHKRFGTENDAFRRDYMRWLVHHEFGVDHRPFRFPGAPVGDPGTIDYWLATWIAAYTALEPIVDGHANVLVVPYEPLCNDPAVWSALAARLGLEPGSAREIAPVRDSAAVLADPALAAAAAALHARHAERAQRWLCDKPVRCAIRRNHCLVMTNAVVLATITSHVIPGPTRDPAPTGGRPADSGSSPG